MKKTILILIIILLSVSAFAKAFTVTEKGRAIASVIISQNATKTEKYAANELVKYIKDISGAELKISTSPAKNNNIFIGRSETADKLAKCNFSEFTADTVVIKCDGNRLILTGGSPNGILYSVYCFLDECLGVKYIIPEEDYIPKNKSISVKNINYTYTPVFMVRDAGFLNTSWEKKSTFTQKHKLNGHGSYQYNNLTKRIGICGFAHSINDLMNPDIYGKEHPEWFAERDGKRILKRGYTQLCLSNEAMAKELIKNVFKTIEEHPTDIFYSITQSDNDNYCECEKCKALSEKYGHSGALLTLINKIADAVKDQYPNILIDTFAYHYTQDPPMSIVPRNNVIIRYCTRTNQIVPIENGLNQKTYNQLTGWRNISKQISVWDYCSDFFNYLLPFPNTQIYQKNLQFFAENKVISVFMQGDGQNTNTWFLPYKNYIYAKLLWNPYLDIDKETKTFMNAFYGPAGNEMYDYLKWNEKIMVNKDINLDRRYESINFYTPEELIKSFEYLNKALDLCKNSQKYYDRVYCDYLCLCAGTLYLDSEIKNIVKNAGVMRIDSKKKLSAQLNEFGINHGITHDSERHELVKSHFAAKEQKHELPKPELCKNLKDDEWFEMTPDDLPNQSERDDISKVVEDPKAVCGKARWISKDKYWPTQLPVPTLFKNENAKYADMYVTYRVEPGTPGKAYEIGFYDFGSKKYAGRFDINNTDTPDGNYKTVKALTIDMENTSPNITMWICGVHDDNIDKGLYIERIFFIYHN